MRGTWQTTDSGGGIGAALGWIGVVLLAAAIARPVAAAAAELVRIVVTIMAVVAVLAVAGGATLLAYRSATGAGTGRPPEPFAGRPAGPAGVHIVAG